jgi:hypothetical protein
MESYNPSHIRVTVGRIDRHGGLHFLNVLHGNNLPVIGVDPVSVGPNERGVNMHLSIFVDPTIQACHENVGISATTHSERGKEAHFGYTYNLPTHC